jgi:hypothetical protein
MGLRVDRALGVEGVVQAVAGFAQGRLATAVVLTSLPRRGACPHVARDAAKVQDRGPALHGEAVVDGGMDGQDHHEIGPSSSSG